MMTLLQETGVIHTFYCTMDERKTSRLKLFFFWQASLRSHETKPLEKNFAANKILSGKTE